MRVLQINKFFFEKGGTERYYFALCRALEGRGHHVSHFSMRHARNAASPFAEYFVNEKDYRSGGSLPSRLRKALSMIHSREAAKKIARLVSDHRPDVAHLHNIYHQITPSIVHVLRRAGIPMVLTLHDYKLVCPRYNLFDGRTYCYRCRGGRFFRAPLHRCVDGSVTRSALLAAEAYWQRVRRVYDAIRIFVAPSEYMRRKVAESGIEPGRVRYLRAFVSPEDVRVDPRHAGITEALPERYVLYFGRLSEEKGLFTLLRAAARAPEVEVVLCGEGPLRKHLEAFADRRLPGRVHFAGFVPKPALNTVIQGARAVVVPSESPENAPFTVLEAMALGVPTVVSDMGGLPELAERAGGCVFRCGDDGELAGRLRGLLTGPGPGPDTGETSRAAIREDFDRDRHVARLESIYAEALSGLRPGE